MPTIFRKARYDGKWYNIDRYFEDTDGSVLPVDDFEYYKQVDSIKVRMDREFTERGIKNINYRSLDDFLDILHTHDKEKYPEKYTTIRSRRGMNEFRSRNLGKRGNRSRQMRPAYGHDDSGSSDESEVSALSATPQNSSEEEESSQTERNEKEETELSEEDSYDEESQRSCDDDQRTVTEQSDYSDEEVFSDDSLDEGLRQRTSSRSNYADDDEFWTPRSRQPSERSRGSSNALLARSIIDRIKSRKNNLNPTERHDNNVKESLKATIEETTRGNQERRRNTNGQGQRTRTTEIMMTTLIDETFTALKERKMQEIQRKKQKSDLTQGYGFANNSQLDGLNVFEKDEEMRKMSNEVIKSNHDAEDEIRKIKQEYEGIPASEVKTVRRVMNGLPSKLYERIRNCVRIEKDIPSQPLQEDEPTVVINSDISESEQSDEEGNGLTDCGDLKYTQKPQKCNRLGMSDFEDEGNESEPVSQKGRLISKNKVEIDLFDPEDKFSIENNCKAVLSAIKCRLDRNFNPRMVREIDLNRELYDIIEIKSFVENISMMVFRGDEVKSIYADENVLTAELKSKIAHLCATYYNILGSDTLQSAKVGLDRKTCDELSTLFIARAKEAEDDKVKEYERTVAQDQVQLRRKATKSCIKQGMSEAEKTQSALMNEVSKIHDELVRKADLIYVKVQEGHTIRGLYNHDTGKDHSLQTIPDMLEDAATLISDICEGNTLTNRNVVTVANLALALRHYYVQTYYVLEGRVLPYSFLPDKYANEHGRSAKSSVLCQKFVSDYTENSADYIRKKYTENDFESMDNDILDDDFVNEKQKRTQLTPMEKKMEETLSKPVSNDMTELIIKAKKAEEDRDRQIRRESAAKEAVLARETRQTKNNATTEDIMNNIVRKLVNKGAEDNATTVTKEQIDSKNGQKRLQNQRVPMRRQRKVEDPKKPLNLGRSLIDSDEESTITARNVRPTETQETKTDNDANPDLARKFIEQRAADIIEKCMEEKNERKRLATENGTKQDAPVNRRDIPARNRDVPQRNRDRKQNQPPQSKPTGITLMNPPGSALKPTQSRDSDVASRRKSLTARKSNENGVEVKTLMNEKIYKPNISTGKLTRVEYSSDESKTTNQTTVSDTKNSKNKRATASLLSHTMNAATLLSDYKPNRQPNKPSYLM